MIYWDNPGIYDLWVGIRTVLEIFFFILSERGGAGLWGRPG